MPATIHEKDPAMTAATEPLRIAVLTVSDSRSLAEDRSGDTLAEALTVAGHMLADRQLVRDDIYAIRATVSAWIADPGIDCILTTGGTGITGRDGTPEAIGPLLDKEINGFGELFRQLSYDEIGTSSLQSRALSGVANGTFIFVLPGSRNACETAWNRIIASQLDAGTRPCNLTMLMPRLKE
jgi:molybdenum cofactor biosynthesis protein B